MATAPSFAVTTFMHQHQAPLAQALGGLAYCAGHQAERLAVQQHARQRVHGVGVIAAGDDDQFRLEALQGR